MSRTEEALAAAPKLKVLSEELASIVKELTGHHHVMIHQFDKLTESHVIAEVADHNVPKANRTELHARALELPRLARSLHSTNRVRALYDRDQKPLRLIGRSGMDSRAPLDLTNSYLRTMSPIHMAYLKNLDVRSTMSATIGTTDNVWGLIVCFSYGSSGMPTSFQTRKICQFVSKVASRNLERLLNKSRLQNWDKIIGAFTSDQLYQHVETPHQLDRQRPRTSPANLLRVFRADFAILSTGEQTRIIGQIERLPEALVILEYFRLHRAESATTSINIERDFPDIQYPFRFKDIAGIFVVPLSHADSFFIFFRRAFPSSKTSIPSATNSSCRNDTMPLAQTEASPETDPDLLIRTCNPWTEADLQTAHVLRLVSGNLLHTWEKDDANHLKRLLIENSAHELRTPLNAVINYLEIAMEGTLEPMIWANLNKSYSASQSLLGATSALLADWNSY
ncbi:unnamed protein product [Periconia digitata]|uniref:Phytochrome chromophore attachment site domain-containing protein n=1 Tax=Periconia digitata TaxID=1303443 RepID=A0A9W4USS1_9PLEO|nr:unnamed protein product [Periconia digitata]